MNIFEKLALEATTLSDLMMNREKTTCEEIVEAFPEGITITDFDLVTTTNQRGEEDTYPVFVFSESNDVYFFGGFVLTKIVNAFIEEFGDIGAAREEFRKTKGLKVQMEYVKAKSSGNKVVNVKLV